MQLNQNGISSYTPQDIINLANIGTFGQYGQVIKGLVQHSVALATENNRLKELLRESVNNHGK